MPLSLADPHLDRLHAEVRAVTAETEALCAGLSPAQLLWCPNPKSWSVAHCFAHLNTTADLYYERVGKGIERTRAAGAQRSGPWRPSLIGRIFLSFTGPRVRWRVPAPPRLMPAGGVTADAAARFLVRQGELASLLSAADGIDLSFERIGSPLSRRLRLTVGDALTMLVGHERRHLEQARRVTATSGFPVG